MSRKPKDEEEPLTPVRTYVMTRRLQKALNDFMRSNQEDLDATEEELCAALGAQSTQLTVRRGAA